MTVSVASPPVESKVRDVRQPEIAIRARRPVLAWSADGGAIALPLPDPETGLASLFRVDLDGSAPRRITASRGGLGDSAPAFSRDGRWLAYTDYEARSTRLYVLPLGASGLANGERQAITGSSSYGVGSPLWSPNGERLLWTDGTQLFEWRRGGTAAPVYVATDLFQGLTAFWKTSTVPQIVFANAGIDSELQAIDLRDGGRAAAGPSAPFLRLAGTQAAPALSPDGRWLAFVTPGKTAAGEIWIAGARGENPRILIADISGRLSWSPDSRHLALHARAENLTQAFVIDVDAEARAGAPRQVTHSAFSIFSPDWTADARYLYVTGNRTPTAERVLRVSADGGELEDLFEGTSAKVSPDGHRIYYGKSLQAGIFERSLDGDVASNAEQRLVDDYVPPQGLAVGKNGIFYVGRDEARKPVALRFFDFALGRSFELGAPPSTPAPSLAVAADGSRVVLERASSVTADLTSMELRRGK